MTQIVHQIHTSSLCKAFYLYRKSLESKQNIFRLNHTWITNQTLVFVTFKPVDALFLTVFYGGKEQNHFTSWAQILQAVCCSRGQRSELFFVADCWRQVSLESNFGLLFQVFKKIFSWAHINTPWKQTFRLFRFGREQHTARTFILFTGAATFFYMY